MTHAKIVSRGSYADVQLDGQDISSAVLGYTITQDAGRPPWLGLRLMPGFAADLDDVTVHVDDVTHRALLALGWTPPPAQAEADQ